MITLCLIERKQPRMIDYHKMLIVEISRFKNSVCLKYCSYPESFSAFKTGAATRINLSRHLVLILALISGFHVEL